MPARYYGSGGKYAKEGERSAAAGSGRKQAKAGEPGFNEPIIARGQFEAGALSAADTRTQTTSVAERRETGFVTTASGRTGTIVDRTDPFIVLSEAFAAKASAAGVSVSQSPFGPGSIVTPGAQLPDGGISQQALTPTPTATFAPFQNTTNPFAANYQGPSTMDIIYSMTPEQAARQGLPAGAVAEVQARTAEAVNNVLDYIETNLGGGDFQRGVYSLVALPLTYTMSQTMALAKGATGLLRPGNVAAKTNAKQLSTFRELISRVMTKETIREYVSKSGRISTVTIREPRSLLGTVAKVGGTVLFLTWFVQELGATYPFAKFRSNEAAETANYAFREAAKIGDIELMKEANEMQINFTNPTSKTVFESLPFINSQKAGEEVTAAQELQSRVNAKVIEHKERELAAGGMTEDEKWAMIREDELNNTRQQIEMWANAKNAANAQWLETQRINRAEASASALRQNAEAAKFWLDYKQQLVKMEEEAMKKQAEFWLAYRKMIAKIQSENQRSNLNFGLL